jgi:hypothetical protein
MKTSWPVREITITAGPTHGPLGPPQQPRRVVSDEELEYLYRQGLAYRFSPRAKHCWALYNAALRARGGRP